MTMLNRTVSALSVVLITITIALSGCARTAPAAPVRIDMPVTLRMAPYTPAGQCGAAFVEHRLPFATGMRVREIGTYLSNGAGLAAGDLDHDRKLDLVFASIDGPAALLHNDGALVFTRHDLDLEFTRDAKMVDIDGDGWLDVVFTDRLGRVIAYRNNAGALARIDLPGVDGLAYATAWGDLNGDGRLDLVTGSYDTELRKRDVPAAEIAAHAGVFLYTNTGAGFTGQRLSDKADALSIALLDLNNDGAQDIWVGNDFLTRDAVWLRSGAGWQPSEPFARMSHSTMSIDWADIDNDGAQSLFTTDMNPAGRDPRTLAEWLPMMAKTDQTKSGDPQITANTLQTQHDGGWVNDAPMRGIDATGWSWAARFADLDRDGWQDLYVVNGMIATDLFGHLPQAELVEENHAYRNTGDRMFTPAPQWRLGSTLSGRGMLPADLDNDGDPDLVVNNLRGPAMLFENRLCGGAGLTVGLRWRGSANPQAIGARATLRSSAGIYARDIRASGGYLSGDAPQMLFGFPAGSTLESLTVIWPDGAQSVINGPPAAAYLEVTR